MSKYTDWVRTLPCCVTGGAGDHVDPHHIKGYNWVTGAGAGKKGSDLLCIPLRHDLHQELHDMGWASWEKKHNISQLEMAARVVAMAESLGIIKVNL